MGMSIAVNYHAGQENIVSDTLPCAGRIVRVAVLDDMTAAEPFWRALEREDAWATPYQRFDLLAAWQHNVGARKGIVPFIVIGFDVSGRPLFLWPLGRKQMGLFRVAGFLGSKHASFNIGLWRRDLAAAIGESDIRNLLTAIAGGQAAVDVLTLYSQPLSWAGVANPFALLPRRLSAEDGACLNLAAAAGIEAAVSPGIRSRLRIKEKKLKKLAGYGYVQPTSAAEIDRLLDAFFALKAVHMRAQGLTNVFAEPGVAEFVRQASHTRLPDGRPLIELHALEGGGEVLALYGAVVDPYRFSAMFNTYTLSQHARHSPGLILLQHMIGACAQRGARSFDIGVGRAHYKSFFCKEPEPLFDTFLALTPRGRLAAPVFRMAFAAKRMIKSKPALWAAVQYLRRARAG
ncbi:MAG TPA: GNAT family N-acetyltransferase [Xanthobacteraceae bacterium]|nr:GNAT family N-acetyltransferase [Xanthobacteraceae bacterium]